MRDRIERERLLEIKPINKTFYAADATLTDSVTLGYK
jgi:hypothetical protein